MSYPNSIPAADAGVGHKPTVVFQLWSDDAGVFFQKETYAGLP